MIQRQSLDMKNICMLINSDFLQNEYLKIAVEIDFLDEIKNHPETWIWMCEV